MVATFVPKLLNVEQKQQRMEVAQESLHVYDNAELLKGFMTGDETWMLH